jgi:TruD family tRNA pseudouridine synthase
MSSLLNLYKQEQEFLSTLAVNQPELLIPGPSKPNQEVLSSVGIDIDSGFLPQGYLSYYPADFIVEEIDKDNNLHSIAPEKVGPSTGSGSTLFADLVKINHSTLEAVDSLALALGIDSSVINYAGIKDKIALTSQLISINNADFDAVSRVNLPGIYLKNFYWAEGNTYKGNLKGNHFTITIRTPATLGEGWLNTSLSKLQDGFYNFYYLQRFGAPRLVSHNLGRALLQGDFEKVVKMFLTDGGFQDVALLNNIRQEALASFGEWEKMAEIYQKLPYTFRLEKDLCEALANDQSDFKKALSIMPDQLLMWVYAYSSYLFNLHLSKLIREDRAIPARLPLLLNPKYQSVNTYVEQLEKDGINDLPNAVKNVLGSEQELRFENTYATRGKAKIIKAKIAPGAVVIAFSLPIGGYATTFLSNLFELKRGLPVPDWVNKNEIDSKKVLGLGSVEEISKIFGDNIKHDILDANFY